MYPDDLKKLECFTRVHDNCKKVYSADAFMITKQLITKCYMYNRVQFPEFGQPLLEEFYKIYQDLTAVARVISGSEETPILIEPLMLMGKLFLISNQIQKGIDQMNAARKLAIKFLKDDLTKYLDFQMQYVTVAA